MAFAKYCLLDSTMLHPVKLLPVGPCAWTMVQKEIQLSCCVLLPSFPGFGAVTTATTVTSVTNAADSINSLQTA